MRQRKMQDGFQSQSDQMRECCRVSKLRPKSRNAPSKHDGSRTDRAIHANLKGGQKEMNQRRITRLNTYSRRVRTQQRISDNDDAEFSEALEKWLKKESVKRQSISSNMHDVLKSV